MTAQERSSAAKKAWDTIRARKLNPPKMTKLEPIKLPKQSAPVSASEMMLRTVVLVLTFNGIGNRRKIATSQINVGEADKEWINATKQLMDAEELEKIQSLYGEERRFVESRVLPHFIKRGVYLLPIDFVEEVEAHLVAGEQKLQPLVNSLVHRRDELIAEAKTRLKNLFNVEDYPTIGELRSAFKFTWRFVHVDSAKSLESVSKELYEKERKKAEADWADTRETIQQLLRSNMNEMVTHLIDRLTPDAEGHPKMFKQGSIDKLSEFLQTFDARNITNDVQMKVLVDKAKGLLKGSDAEMLRSNDDVRQYVCHGFNTIKTLLDPMVVVKPTRRIVLED